MIYDNPCSFFQFGRTFNRPIGKRCDSNLPHRAVPLDGEWNSDRVKFKLPISRMLQLFASSFCWRVLFWATVSIFWFQSVKLMKTCSALKNATLLSTRSFGFVKTWPLRVHRLPSPMLVLVQSKGRLTLKWPSVKSSMEKLVFNYFPTTLFPQFFKISVSSDLFLHFIIVVF